MSEPSNRSLPSQGQESGCPGGRSQGSGMIGDARAAEPLITTLLDASEFVRFCEDALSKIDPHWTKVRPRAAWCQRLLPHSRTER